MNRKTRAYRSFLNRYKHPIDRLIVFVMDRRACRRSHVGGPNAYGRQFRTTSQRCSKEKAPNHCVSAMLSCLHMRRVVRSPRQRCLFLRMQGRLARDQLLYARSRVHWHLHSSCWLASGLVHSQRHAIHARHCCSRACRRCRRLPHFRRAPPYRFGDRCDILAGDWDRR